MRRTASIMIALLTMGITAAVSAAATTGVILQTGDDHAATNSGALEAAIDHAAIGDTVSINEGKFALSATLCLRSGINVAGAGAARTTLSAAFGREQPMIVGREISSVDLSGFTLDGAGNSNVTQGIELEKSTSLNIHDLTIANFSGSDRSNLPLGPHAIDCTRSVTKSIFNAINCRSIGVGRTWGSGIRLSWGSTGNRITNCVVANTGRGGIFCNDGSTDNMISDNTVTDSGGVGLGIEVQNCDRSLIERNAIDHWLSVDNSSMSAVRGNSISASDKTYKLCGIEIVDSHDVIVSGNKAIGGAKVGLSISGPHPKERLIFSHNLFGQATTWGAQIQGDAGGVRELYFNDNAFEDTKTGSSSLYPNQGHGVRINGNAHWITFDHNTITGNAGVGLQITGDNVNDLFFYGNRITENHGGVIDSDPIPHIVCRENKTLPQSTRWEQSAERTAQPAVDVQIDGATLLRADPTTYAAVPDQMLRFKISPHSSFVPHDYLWDFGQGLPRSGPLVNEAFPKDGGYFVNVVAWDSTGNAVHSEVIVDVKP